MSATGTVIGAVAGSAAIAAVAEIKRTGRPPRLRIAIGGFVAGVALVALASFAPSMATGLAVLLIITTVLTAGYELVAPLQSLIK